MRIVTIVGVGLIGGSFALALRKAGFDGRIIGVSSPETLDLSKQLGVIDQGATLEEASQQSDLIYLAQPICRIIETIPKLNRWVRPGTLVTDAGSTKARITEQAAAHLTSCQFLGGHPLAGKESRGVSAATPGLFQDRIYVITPSRPQDLETKAVSQFLEWLGRIQAIPLSMEASTHDRILSYTSHLPQLASTALASFLGTTGESTGEIFGPALLDMTRLALSPFDIWSDIVATNELQIDRALAGYIAALEQLRSELASGLDRRFAEGARYASRLRSGTKSCD